MSLPSCLAAEIRLAFHLCRPHTRSTNRSPFSTISYLNKRATSATTSRARRNESNQSANQNRGGLLETSQADNGSSSTKLTRNDGKGTSLDRPRATEVPVKVLPKAQLGPKHKLSPEQRLHIEHLTRHPPPQRAPKVYKERLLIYHAGHGWINTMVILRAMAIVPPFFFTAIWAPANYSYGTALWEILAVWLASFVPIMLLDKTTRSLATEIWLRLPPAARSSAHAAMTYARNLPRDAQLEIRFMRWTSHVGGVMVKLVDTIPIEKKILRPVNFKWTGPWVNPGTYLRPNPTEFYVKSKSAGGRAAKDTVPGLWSIVYKRLTGLEPGAVSKWRG